MVDLAMSIFEFLSKFLIFWHLWHPWGCICSVCRKRNLKQIELIPPSVAMLTSISFNLINRVKYQLCQSQKWQYHKCEDKLCARQFVWEFKNNNFFAGYSSYLGKSRYSNSNIKPNEELKLTLKFETISSDLPAKLHLELCDQSGRVLAFV